MDVLNSAPNKPDILKLGLVHPLPRAAIVNFLRSHREIKVLEELDDVIGQEVKAIAFEEKIDARIVSKLETEDWIGEYTPDKVDAILRRTWPDLLTAKAPLPMKGPEAPWRPPQMCPDVDIAALFMPLKRL